MVDRKRLEKLIPLICTEGFTSEKFHHNKYMRIRRNWFEKLSPQTRQEILKDFMKPLVKWEPILTQYRRKPVSRKNRRNRCL